MGSAFGIIAAYILEQRTEREIILKREILYAKNNNGGEGEDFDLPKENFMKSTYKKYIPQHIRQHISSFINLFIVIGFGMAILKIDDSENNFTECFYFAVITGTTIGKEKKGNYYCELILASFFLEMA